MSALTQAGLTALAQGDLRQAEALLRDAVALTPSPDALCGLGFTLARATRGDEALVYLARALALAPKRVDAWCALGELKLERLDYKGAADALGQCLTLDPHGTHPAGVRARMLIKRVAKTLSA